MKWLATSEARERRMAWGIGAFVLVGALLVLASTYRSVEEDRQVTEAAARDSSLVAVRLLDEHVAQTIKEAERNLEAVAYEVRRQSRDAAISDAAVNEILTRAQPFNTVLKTLQYVDTQGRATVSSITYAAFQTDADDRTYIRPMLSHPDWRHTVLGVPFRRFYDGHLVLPVAVNLVDARGKYLGIISTDLSIQYFGDLYRRVAMDSDALVALVTDHGQVIVRATRNSMESGGALDPQGPARAIWSGAHEGQLRDAALLRPKQPQASIYTWRKVQGYPVSAIFGLTENQVLGAWRERSRERWLGAGVFTVFLILSGGLMLFHMQRMALSARALRVSEARFSALFAESPVPLALLDMSSGQMTDANACFLRQFAYQRADVLGKTPFELGIWRDPEMRQPYLQQLQRDGHVRDHEVDFVDRGGRNLSCLLSAHLVDIAERRMIIFSPIDVSAQREIAAQLRDLNETLERRVAERTQSLLQANADLLRANEELRSTRDELARVERLAALGNLMTGISHELNTPLGNAIAIASSMQGQLVQLQSQFEGGEIKRSGLTAFLRGSAEGARILMRNLQRAIELIGALKDVAGEGAAGQRCEFDVGDLLGLLVLQNRAKLQRLGITVDLAAQPGMRMLGYPHAMSTVFEQVLDNALEHGLRDQAEGRLTITAGQQGELVAINLDDNGRGMTPEVRSRVFEPFFTTSLGKGTSGLGMYIVYSLVTAVMGGTVAVESLSGGGTRVALLLPAVAPVTGGEQR